MSQMQAIPLGTKTEEYVRIKYLLQLSLHSTKVEDVRVFFGNVPQSEPEARVRALVEPLGEIVLIDIQPTKLHNRRCSGFIHMTSLAAAEAVRALQAIVRVRQARRQRKL